MYDRVAYDLIFLRKFVTCIKQLNVFGTVFELDSLKKMIRILSNSNIKVCFISSLTILFVSTYFVV